MSYDNASPTIHAVTVPTRGYGVTFDDLDMEDSHSHHPTPPPPTRQPLDALEVFEYIRGLNDPEHPLTLEQLNVVSLDLIAVNDVASTVDVRFTPTIPHCSMATLIGLCIRVKLQRALPPRFKTVVRITPGSHNQEDTVNKQLGDKERVAAAIENGSLVDVVKQCFKGSDDKI